MLRRLRFLFLIVLLIPTFLAPQQQATAAPRIKINIDDAIDVIVNLGRGTARVGRTVDPSIAGRVTAQFDTHVVKNIDNIRINGIHGPVPLTPLSSQDLITASKWTICMVIWNYDLNEDGEFVVYLDSQLYSQSFAYRYILDIDAQIDVILGVAYYVAALSDQLSATTDPFLQDEIIHAAIEEFSACEHQP